MRCAARLTDSNSHGMAIYVSCRLSLLLLLLQLLLLLLLCRQAWVPIPVRVVHIVHHSVEYTLQVQKIETFCIILFFFFAEFNCDLSVVYGSVPLDRSVGNE